MFLSDPKVNPDRFILISGKLTESYEKLEAGVYNLGFIGQGPMSPPQPYFEKTTKYDDGMIIEGGVFTKARKSIAKFVKPEMYEARKEMKMLNKLGIIFDGKPGTGKTFLAGQLCSEYAKNNNAIGIISNKHDGEMYADLIDSIREYDKDRLIIIVMDEFEKSRARNSSDMLSFLDGSSSKDNVIVIATINDKSELASYITNRPGRFETILDFKSDDVLILKSMIEQCIPKSFKKSFNVDQLVKEFSNKANANKFGLSNNNDDFTIDRMRMVIRDLIADKIEEKKNSVETITTISSVAKATEGMIESKESAKLVDENKNKLIEKQMEVLFEEVFSKN